MLAASGVSEGLFLWDFPVERSRIKKDWWINLVDMCRGGVSVRVCTNEHVKISAQEAEDQATKLVSATTWRTWLVGGEARGSGA